MLRRGPASGELTVAHQRANKQHDQMQCDQADSRCDRKRKKKYHPREDDERLDHDNEPVRNERPGLESDHEGQEVKRQRRDP